MAMRKHVEIPHDKGLPERLADIAAGYVLIGSILAMGLVGMACTLQLVIVERSDVIVVER